MFEFWGKHWCLQPNLTRNAHAISDLRIEVSGRISVTTVSYTDSCCLLDCVGGLHLQGATVLSLWHQRRGNGWFHMRSTAGSSHAHVLLINMTLIFVALLQMHYCFCLMSLAVCR